jgi:hypothetical protein
MPDSTIKRRKISNEKAEVSQSNGKKVQKEASPSPSPSGSESESEEEVDTTPEQTPGTQEDGADAPKKTFKDLVSILYATARLERQANGLFRASSILSAKHVML